MTFLLQLYAYLFGYEYAKRKFKNKEIVEKEKGVRGVKGIRDTFREVDDKILKNKNTD
ncbi:MAG: hypothetical protein ACTSO6_11930 [Promethearchaeota archaeon]